MGEDDTNGGTDNKGGTLRDQGGVGEGMRALDGLVLWFRLVVVQLQCTLALDTAVILATTATTATATATSATGVGAKTGAKVGAPGAGAGACMGTGGGTLRPVLSDRITEVDALGNNITPTSGSGSGSGSSGSGSGGSGSGGNAKREALLFPAGESELKKHSEQ
ncbi:hypothetical protein B484DRAFT_109234 [Ochromonadaceae sp. CCMP2298]|nr:hypothetical protein B484DRAFT_109234 [Ochromonadaceae sp. CCMP2298]